MQKNKMENNEYTETVCLEDVIKEALITADIEPEVIKAIRDIFEITIFSINIANIDINRVKNSSFEKIIDGLRKDISKLKVQITNGDDKSYENRNIDLDIDVSIKNIIIDVLCIQIKRGRMGYDC